MPLITTFFFILINENWTHRTIRFELTTLSPLELDIITYAEVVVIHILWRPVIKLVPVYTIVWYNLEEQLLYF